MERTADPVEQGASSSQSHPTVFTGWALYPVFYTSPNEALPGSNGPKFFVVLELNSGPVRARRVIRTEFLICLLLFRM